MQCIYKQVELRPWDYHTDLLTAKLEPVTNTLNHCIRVVATLMQVTTIARKFFVGDDSHTEHLQHVRVVMFRTLGLRHVT